MASIFSLKSLLDVLETFPPQPFSSPKVRAHQCHHLVMISRSWWGSTCLSKVPESDFNCGNICSYLSSSTLLFLFCSSTSLNNDKKAPVLFILHDINHSVWLVCEVICPLFSSSLSFPVDLINCFPFNGTFLRVLLLEISSLPSTFFSYTILK